MGKIYTWQNGPNPTDVTILPMPYSVSGNNICSIGEGLGSGEWNAAIDTDNNLYTWTFDDNQHLILLDLPQEITNKKICSIAAGNLYAAIDTDNNLHTFTYDYNKKPVFLDLPTEVKNKKICNAFFGYNTVAVIDTNNNLYTWTFDANHNPIILDQPLELNNKKICNVSSCFISNPSFAAIDTDNKLYVWTFDGNQNPIALDQPPEVNNKKICSSSCGYMTIAAIDTDNNLYTWRYSDSFEPIVLNQPQEVKNKKICNVPSFFSSSYGFAAIDIDQNLYTWTFDQNLLNPIILAQPTVLQGKQIYNASGFYSSQGFFIALTYDTDFPFSCPNNIRLRSDKPQPVYYNLPKVSDPCLQVETTLPDGTVIYPGHTFPFGTTTVTCRAIPKCATDSSCSQACTSCTCPLSSCSFTVTINPLITPQTTPVTPAINIPNTTIKASKLYDWVVTRDVHQVTFNLAANSNANDDTQENNDR
jgi:hypothetical protein